MAGRRGRLCRIPTPRTRPPLAGAGHPELRQAAGSRSGECPAAARLATRNSVSSWRDPDRMRLSKWPSAAPRDFPPFVPAPEPGRTAVRGSGPCVVRWPDRPDAQDAWRCGRPSARMPGWQVSPPPGAAARRIVRSRRAVRVVRAPGKLRRLLSSSVGSLARGVVSSASWVRALNPLVLAGTRLLVAGWYSLGQPAPRKRGEMGAACEHDREGRQAGGQRWPGACLSGARCLAAVRGR